MLHKPINHLLRSQAWAREKLKPFAGKTVRLNASPLQFTFSITETGEIATSNALPDAEITVDSNFIPQIISKTQSPSREIKIAGDADFAATIAFVFKNLKWDIEEDLSHLVGDVLAHRIALSGTKLLNWGKDFHESFSRSLAEYLTEEKFVLIKNADMDTFLKEVDALREATDRLEKKFMQLTKKIKTPHV